MIAITPKNRKKFEKSLPKRQQTLTSLPEPPFAPLKHQQEFFADINHRYLALVSGYGGGKTKALCYKAVQLSYLNKGYAGILFSPTATLANDILIPELEQQLIDLKINYTLKKSPLPSFIINWGDLSSTIYIRSFENSSRIIAYNLSWAGLDELDTVRLAVAERGWRLLLGRIRTGNVRQIVATSTPEGFNFLYKQWVESASPERRLIQARTLDNPHLPLDFLEALYQEYPPELVEAYVNGQFVNLSNKLVYPNFSRQLNATNETIKESDRLLIGLDFNVGNCSAVVLVRRGDNYHAVDELISLLDTPSMIVALKQRYSEHEVILFPDASGKARKTTNASISDIQLLVQAGFTVKAGNSNPAVRDRVASVNAAICNANNERKFLVNTAKCPRLVEALERQPYDESGSPDKTLGYDHIADATGYALVQLLPLKSNTIRKSNYSYR